MPEKILLKKYANRRLYDTEKSRYVTLDQVANMIKEGRQVGVIDAKTKEDVTAFILTQILLETARSRNALLPVPLLHLIIQYGEGVLEEFFDKYLQQTIENYLAYKRSVDEQFRKWLDMGADLSDMAQKTMQGIAPLQSFFEPLSSPKAKQKKKERL
jgi:polyhydroxyalkanoate synthesis repressor PhaR